MQDPLLIPALARVGAEMAAVAAADSSTSDRAVDDFLREATTFLARLREVYPDEVLQITGVDNKLSTFRVLKRPNIDQHAAEIFRLLAEALQGAEQRMSRQVKSPDAQATFCRLVRLSNGIQLHPGQHAEAVAEFISGAELLMTQMVRLNPQAQDHCSMVRKHLSMIRDSCHRDPRVVTLQVMEILASLMQGEPIGSTRLQPAA